MKRIALVLCLILSIPALSSAAYWPTTHPDDAYKYTITYWECDTFDIYIWRENGELWMFVDSNPDGSRLRVDVIVENGNQHTSVGLTAEDGTHIGTAYVDMILKFNFYNDQTLPFDINTEFIYYGWGIQLTVPAGPDYIPPDDPDPCDLCDQCPVCETCEVCQECEECPNTETVYNQGYQAGLAALEAAKKDAYDKGYQAGLAAAQCEGACTNEELLDAQQHGYARGYSDGRLGVGFNNPGYILPCIDVVSGLDIPITCLKYKDICFSFTLEYNLKKSAWLIGPDIQVLP